MGQTNPIRKTCACGREIKSRTAERCAECSLAGPAQYWMGHAIRTGGGTDDIADANVCPKKAAFVDEIDARIRARKAGAR